MPSETTRPVRVRIAPSPTGPVHIGLVRTTLFNWLFAKKEEGVFILRIEDTDKVRSENRFEDEILDSLSWLGLHWDEGPDGKGAHGPYRQSERSDYYRTHLEKLIAEGKAYYCYCTKEDLEAEKMSLMTQGLPPKYGGHCRAHMSPPPGKSPQVIRFKMPETNVEWKDMVRGTVSFDAGLFGDIVIAKDLDSPVYNFAAAVDDGMMEISHVIRGEDHISNTPKQILLTKALGFPEPVFAHIPLILAKDRSKLSKRSHEISALAYREAGYLPEAVLNFLALLGWHPRNDQEIFKREELVEMFSIARVQKSGAIFNEEKLAWLNTQHMKRLPDDELVKMIRNYFAKDDVAEAMLRDEALLKRVLRAERDRITSIKDFWNVAGFFFALPEYEASLLRWDKDPNGTVNDTLQSLAEILRGMEGEITVTTCRDALVVLTEKNGKGSVLWPLRVALSGRAASPDPFSIIEVLGKEESVQRVEVAIQKWESIKNI